MLACQYIIYGSWLVSLCGNHDHLKSLVESISLGNGACHFLPNDDVLELYMDISSWGIQGMFNAKKLVKGKGIRDLNLSRNQIERVKGLGGLSGLEVLRLSRNRIDKITGLGKLTNLAELYLEDNLIPGICGLSRCKKLRVLALDGNFIKNLDGLEGLERLEILSVGHNCITRVEDLAGVLELESLRKIYLDGNPVLNCKNLHVDARLKRLIF